MYIINCDLMIFLVEINSRINKQWFVEKLLEIIRTKRPS